MDECHCCQAGGVFIETIFESFLCNNLLLSEVQRSASPEPRRAKVETEESCTTHPGGAEKQAKEQCALDEEGQRPAGQEGDLGGGEGGEGV